MNNEDVQKILEYLATNELVDFCLDNVEETYEAIKERKEKKESIDNSLEIITLAERSATFLTVIQKIAEIVGVTNTQKERLIGIYEKKKDLNRTA